MSISSAHRTASTAVIEAVANQEGVDKRNLRDPILFEAIDGEALDTICQYDSVHVSFEFHGYRVTVDGENNVNLTDAT